MDIKKLEKKVKEKEKEIQSLKYTLQYRQGELDMLEQLLREERGGKKKSKKKNK